MSVSFHLRGTNGNQTDAKVTSRGQVVTAPLGYSEFYNTEANVINTAFNLIPPITGKRFVLTDIILYANKNVGAGDATVDLYEAASITETTILRSIINQEMVKQTTLTLNGLNVICSEGVWINIKTDDATVFANIAGYYVTA